MVGYMIGGVAALAFVLLVLQGIAYANTAKLATLVRWIAAILVAAVGIGLLFARRFEFAIPLLGLAWAIVARAPAKGFSRAGSHASMGPDASTPSGGQMSSVRTAFLLMQLDLDTGAMEGEVLTGRFAGQPLGELTKAELLALYEECRADGDSLSLLEVYLDRRFAGWRDDVEGDTGAGSRSTTHSGAMSEEEAYEILGLRPGASADEIRAAHRQLMKAIHPDRGGSAFLAAKVNQAKDRLLHPH